MNGTRWQTLKRLCCCLSLFAFLTTFANAQPTASITPNVGYLQSDDIYTYSGPLPGSNWYRWDVFGGTIIAQQDGWVRVRWTGSSGHISYENYKFQNEDADVAVTILCLPLAGDNRGNAIDLGALSNCAGNRRAVDSRNIDPAACYNNDYGAATSGLDLYYNLHVDERSSVEISTCGSSFDTEVYLENAYGNVLALNGANGPSCQNPQASVTSVLEPGDYVIIVDGRTAADYGDVNLVVTAHPVPFTVSSEQVVQAGGTATLTATGADAYAWSPAAGLSATTGGTVTATPATTTTYTVTGTRCNGQTATAKVAVVVALDNLNYIVSRTTQFPQLVEAAEIPEQTIRVVALSTTFFNGLGEPMQAVAKQASFGGRDVVTPVTYDSFGRVAQTFLPYAQGTDGRFKADALSATTGQPAFYNTNGQTGTLQGGNLNVAHDAAAYGQTVYEPSPLNRAEQQGAAGADWQPKALSPAAASNHSLKIVERTNTGAGIGSDDVLQWSYAAGATPELTVGGAYAAGQLRVTETTDEANNKVLEFKDGRGRLILRKTQASTPSGGTICASTTDGGTLSLQVPTGNIITGIQSATYGTGSGTCGDFLFTCSANVTGMVRNLLATPLAGGTGLVSFAVPNPQMPVDPCFSQTKTLTVTACYAPATEALDAYTETYYVYDDFDLLHGVVQPNGSKAVRASGVGAVNAAFLQKWCFLYRYDARHRITEKHVPGAGWTAMVYDRRDQVVGTQDQRQAAGADNPWRLTKYDVLGRPIFTAYAPLFLNREDLQTALNGLPAAAVQFESRISTGLGYTLNQAYPTLVEGDVRTLVFYDDYAYPQLSGKPFVPEFGVANHQVVNELRGQVTGRAERVLDVAPTWLTSLTFYDYAYRPIQTQSGLYPSGTTRTTSSLDFLGRPQTSLTTHIRNGVTHASSNRFTYDQGGRVLRTYQTMEAGQATVRPEILVAMNEYNEVGQLVDKKLHSTDGRVRLGTSVKTVENPSPDFLQSVDFRYNIRGWLTNINNRKLENNGIRSNDADPNADDLVRSDPDLFGLELVYNAGQNRPSSVPQFNGNISEAAWKTRNARTGAVTRGYGYRYDKMNRLIQADFWTFQDASQTWTNQGTDYSVPLVNYDANGNLTRLERKGRVNALVQTTAQFGDLDKLTYSYDGNRLVGVDEDAGTAMPNGLVTAAAHDFEDNSSRFSAATPEYRYDEVGSLISDANKGISYILYNELNLPRFVYPDGWNGEITYVYSASGTKLQQIAADLNTGATRRTDYCAGFVYEDNALQYAPMPEGRVLYELAQPQPGAYQWKYEYHLKDHLGSLRFAFRNDDGSTQQRTASMEPANASQEEQEFTHVAETRQRDALHARTGDYVARLSATEGRRVGPSIRWPVQAGDSVVAEVYGRYDHAAMAGRWLRRSAAVVGGAVVSGGIPTYVDNVQPVPPRRRWLPTLGLSIGFVPQLLKPRPDELPRAFLRYELFDRDSQLVAVRTRPLQRTASDDWQHLQAGIKADSAGYVQVSVINESGAPAYFDDLALRPVDPNLYQENHYDPWGLNLAGIEEVGQPDSKFQYNGKEKQTDFGLNWTDYGARMYDAQLGRWHSVDAASSTTPNYSPYTYCYNSPVNKIDPSGNYSFGAITLSREEEAQLRKDHGRGEAYRTARADLMAQHKQEIVSALGDVSQILENNPEIKSAFMKFSGFKAKQLNDLFTENGKGPSYSYNGNQKVLGLTEPGERRSFTSSFNGNEGRTHLVATMMHELVHGGDITNRGYGQNGFFGMANLSEKGVLGAANSSTQRNALDLAYKQLDNDPTSQKKFLNVYKDYYGSDGRVNAVEIGYAFENKAFLHPIVSPQSYKEFGERYLGIK